MEHQRTFTLPRLGSRAKKRILFVGGILFALAACTIAVTLITSHTQSHTVLPNTVVEAATFPVFYPNPMPLGLRLDPNSPAMLENQAVTFTLDSTKSFGHIVVTEQTRPPIMEEITKTKQFKTSQGDAYLADLNGQTAGFLVTDKTLVILSVQQPVADDVVAAALTSMSAL